MSPLDLSLVFVFGLVSSLHCVQMCGPIVLAYSLPLAGAGAGRRGLVLAHAAYNSGRLLIYMLLGAIAGALGSAAGMAGRLAGMANGARIFAGAAMVLAAIAMFGLLPTTPGLVTIERRGPASALRRAAGRLLLSPAPASKFRLGLLLGFLPCGLIYGALLKSVDAGAALPGALTMLAFGLGTATALFPMGLASGFLGRRLGPWSNRLAALSLMLFGAFLLWRGLAGPAAPHSHVAG
jgi:uncharacterized protein